MMRPTRRPLLLAPPLFITLLLAVLAVLAVPPAAAGPQKEPAALPGADRTFSERTQVTAVELLLDVRDREGQVPADLTPADFLVHEDGREVTVIGIERFDRGSAAGVAGRAERTPRPSGPAAPTAASAGGPVTDWRIVVYLDAVLSSPRTIRRACEGLSAQAGRLTELGTVEVIVANPAAEQVLPATRSARLVEQTLDRLAREVVGRDELRRHRRRFFDAVQVRGEMDGTGRPIYASEPLSGNVGSGPGTGQGGGNVGGASPDDPPPELSLIRGGSNLDRKALVRSAVMEELILLSRQHDVLLSFLASYLESGPRALMLINDGYDLDPREFYLAGITPGSDLFAEVNRYIQNQSTAVTTERLGQVLSASGWVNVGMAFGGIEAGSTFGAEVAGGGRLAGLLYAEESSVFNLPSSMVVHPLGPLNQLAHATGGETLTGVAKLPAALQRLGERVRLTYQVSRPADGALHRVEVEPRRAGLEVKAPRFSGSPAPEEVASARARRLLAGDVDRGGLPVVAAVALEEAAVGAGVAADEAATRRATFQARLDLTPVQQALAGQPPTTLRVTLAVSFPHGPPFVRSEEVTGQRLSGLDAWTYTAPLTLPAEVDKVSVVIEEVATGDWGGSLAALVAGPLPAAVQAGGGRVGGVGPTGSTGAAAALHGDEAAAGVGVPADLLPGRKPILLLEPEERVVVGKVRFETVVGEPSVERVDFLVDGRQAASRDRAPFEARVDLGPLPEQRVVEAVAFDAAGAELGRDSLVVNAGTGKFRVRIIEPRPGPRVGAIDVEAEVDLPPDSALAQLEIRWNGHRQATLFEPPFRARVMVPHDSPEGYLTVVATTGDGATAEDVVFLNGDGASDRVDVKLVELFTVVTDPERRPVRDLPRDEFRVYEQGIEQPIADFRDGSEMPLNLGMLIDTSGSMYPAMREVQRAAIDFLLLGLRENDRALVVDFASRPRLVQPLTADREALVRAIAGLRAEGSSALCDALVFTLVQMREVEGRRALVLLTDGVGRDERVSFDTCLRVVQRSGIPIYAVLLAGDDPTAKEGGVSSATLTKLVAPVGGRLYLAESAERLGRLYRSILDELHSQYLLTYYPPAPGLEGWRAIGVEVERPGLEARTLAGYYP